MRRRALAFDVVKACGFHAMNGYHADLFDHLHQAPSPGYNPVSLLLRADRAAFLWMSERLTTLKRDAQGNLPSETEIQRALAQPSVSFHLLPLPASKASNEKLTPKPKAKPDPGRSRSPPRAHPGQNTLKQKGKGKKGKRGRGPNVPKALIGKSLQTNEGERICWAFNLEPGCKDARMQSLVKSAIVGSIWKPNPDARNPAACRPTSDSHHRTLQFCSQTPFEAM